MRKNKMARKFLPGILAVMTAVSMVFSGCGKEEQDVVLVNDQEETKEQTMGRYLEEELPLPEGIQRILAVTQLEDGTIRIVAMDSNYQANVYDSSDEGASWTESVDLKAALGEKAVVTRAALASSGEIFADVYQEDEENPDDSHNYPYLINASGQAAKLQLRDTEPGESFIWQGVFSDDHRLYINVGGLGSGVHEVDVDSGQVEKVFPEERSMTVLGICGDLLLVVTDGTLHYYDRNTGKPGEEEKVLTEQLTAKEDYLYTTNSSSYPMFFIEGEREQIFYVNPSGIYSYQKGGSLVEQVVDGELTSLSAPSTCLVDGVSLKDGGFLLGVFTQGEVKLLKYRYSADTPARPQEEIKVYSMMESGYLQQAASQFQKANPDVYVKVETGLSGQDGITVGDAQKNLNTEIMAGNGPDVFFLDGLSAEAYEEKGLLADVSDLLSEEELLENIRNAYVNEDGSITKMPVSFGIPLVVGGKQHVENITDLTSFADVIQNIYENEKPLESSFYYGPYLYGMGAGLLSCRLAPMCVSGWFREDGSIDEEQVRTFLEQCGRIYATCSHERESEIPAAAGEYQEFYGVYPSGLNSWQGYLEAGVLTSPYECAEVYSVMNMDDTVEYKAFSGQEGGCFIPINTAVLSVKSSDKSAAQRFYKYLFSEDMQRARGFQGLPVKETVYMDPVYWGEGTRDNEASSSTSDNRTGEVHEFVTTQPTVEQVAQMQELGKSLTKAANVNQLVVESMYEQVERYVQGEVQLEEAVDAFLKEMKIYLAE